MVTTVSCKVWSWTLRQAWPWIQLPVTSKFRVKGPLRSSCRPHARHMRARLEAEIEICWSNHQTQMLRRMVISRLVTQRDLKIFMCHNIYVFSVLHEFYRDWKRNRFSEPEKPHNSSVEAEVGNVESAIKDSSDTSSSNWGCISDTAICWIAVAQLACSCRKFNMFFTVHARNIHDSKRSLYFVLGQWLTLLEACHSLGGNWADRSLDPQSRAAIGLKTIWGVMRDKTPMIM